MATHLYRVTSLTEFFPGMFECVVEPEEGYMHFESGQYVEILYPDGHYYPFSIANAPNADGTLEFHMRLVDHDYALAALLLEIEQTFELQLRGPMGTSIYRPDWNSGIIMVAGGAGIAPMKAIIEAASDEQELHLFWGVKSPSELYLDDLFQELHHIEKLNTYIPVVSGFEPWRGENGWVHEVVVEHFEDLSDKLVYVSGPYEMVASAHELYQHYALPDEQFLTDML